MAFDDFFDWLESDAGEVASQAVDDIQMALAGASVDINNRKIIWADGEIINIDQSIEKLKSISTIDIKILRKHILLWLEIDFVPENLKEKDMEFLEKQMIQWIIDYEYGVEKL